MSKLRRILENAYRRQFLRRFFVFAWLVVGIVACYVAAFALRYDGRIPPVEWESIATTIPYAAVLFVVLSLVFGIYKGIWTLFSFGDCVRHASVMLSGGVVFGGIVYWVNGWTYVGYPRSVLIIYPVLLVAWEFAGRTLARLILEYTNRNARLASGGAIERIVILGDPEHSDQVMRALVGPGRSCHVCAVFSDTGRGGRSTLRGVPVHDSLEKLESVVRRQQVASLVFVGPYTSPTFIRRVVDRLGESRLSVNWRIVPSIEDLATGVLNAESMRRVQIEDLLDRPAYRVDFDRLREFVEGRRVLVTGAGGSIGSEICRQVLRLHPKSLTLFESNEYCLFSIERELRSQDGSVEIVAFSGDVTRAEQVRQAIARTDGVEVVYHAAAYKHVDMMERNAGACFHNNVVGTAVTARVCEEQGVAEFVLVSTDKAVRPTSLMGASKRLAEKVLMERATGDTNFKAVRFGNVLGSSGSVVPIFREQIERGGPVTVTSPEVTRFFMTIPEAVELVLAAGAVSEDRRIFVLEMGQPVRIDVLARRMIELSGFVPDEDIPIDYTGLKAGEKEYEELLTEDENVTRTDLDRIWVVEKDGREDLEPVDLGRLLELIDDGEEDSLRQYAHSLIPGSRLFGEVGLEGASARRKRPVA